MTTMQKIPLLLLIAALLAVPSMRGEETVSERSATEDNFIAGLHVADCRPSDIILPDSLEHVSDSLWRHSGEHYHLRSVNASTYYFIGADSVAVPVCDPAYPAESIADLILLPMERSFAVPMTVTVLKHEPGSKETIETTVGNFVAYCRQEGCIPFWGVEKIEGDTMQGALFLYNPSAGYDHVLKITCQPEAVIAGKGAVTARASLYIPTKNVKTLFDDDNQVQSPTRPKYQVGKK